MKLIALITMLISLCPLFAAGEPTAATDPFAGVFFPPELVLMARDRIALTSEQLDSLRARLEKTRQRSEELKKKLEAENSALMALVRQERVDETALFAQLDRVLDLEREAKHLHLGLVSAVKNMLTPEQQAKLRELGKDGAVRLGEEIHQKLTEKLERVHQAAESWAASGRDPSEILRSMEEKFKSLMDSGKAIEAETELNHALELLSKDAK